MLNFMRKPFDDWLNKVAQENGAEFHDECEFKNFIQNDAIEVHLKNKQDGEILTYETRYLLDATGLRSENPNAITSRRLYRKIFWCNA